MEVASKRLEDLDTEDLQALLILNMKRVRELEEIIARRQINGSEVAQSPLACKTRCDKHIWITNCSGPRDNGESFRVCKKCGLME